MDVSGLVLRSCREGRECGREFTVGITPGSKRETNALEQNSFQEW